MKRTTITITDEVAIGEAASFQLTYEDTTEWQTLVINLGANSNYVGLLRTLRLDYFHESPGSHHVDVQYIALFKSQEAAESFHGNFSDFSDNTLD